MLHSDTPATGISRSRAKPRTYPGCRKDPEQPRPGVGATTEQPRTHSTPAPSTRIHTHTRMKRPRGQPPRAGAMLLLWGLLASVYFSAVSLPRAAARRTASVMYYDGYEPHTADQISRSGLFFNDSTVPNDFSTVVRPQHTAAFKFAGPARDDPFDPTTAHVPAEVKENLARILSMIAETRMYKERSFLQSTPPAGDVLFEATAKELHASKGGVANQLAALLSNQENAVPAHDKSTEPGFRPINLAANTDTLQTAAGDKEHPKSTRTAINEAPLSPNAYSFASNPFAAFEDGASLIVEEQSQAPYVNAADTNGAKFVPASREAFLALRESSSPRGFEDDSVCSDASTVSFHSIEGIVNAHAAPGNDDAGGLSEAMDRLALGDRETLPSSGEPTPALEETPVFHSAEESASESHSVDSLSTSDRTASKGSVLSRKSVSVEDHHNVENVTIPFKEPESSVSVASSRSEGMSQYESFVTVNGDVSEQQDDHEQLYVSGADSEVRKLAHTIVDAAISNALGALVSHQHASTLSQDVVLDTAGANGNDLGFANGEMSTSQHDSRLSGRMEAVPEEVESMHSSSMDTEHETEHDASYLHSIFLAIVNSMHIALLPEDSPLHEESGVLGYGARIERVPSDSDEFMSPLEAAQRVLRNESSSRDQFMLTLLDGLCQRAQLPDGTELPTLISKQSGADVLAQTMIAGATSLLDWMVAAKKEGRSDEIRLVRNQAVKTFTYNAASDANNYANAWADRADRRISIVSPTAAPETEDMWDRLLRERDTGRLDAPNDTVVLKRSIWNGLAPLHVGGLPVHIAVRYSETDFRTPEEELVKQRLDASIAVYPMGTDAVDLSDAFEFSTSQTFNFGQYVDLSGVSSTVPVDSSSVSQLNRVVRGPSGQPARELIVSVYVDGQAEDIFAQDFLADFEKAAVLGEESADRMSPDNVDANAESSDDSTTDDATARESDESIASESDDEPLFYKHVIEESNKSTHTPENVGASTHLDPGYFAFDPLSFSCDQDEQLPESRAVLRQGLDKHDIGEEIVAIFGEDLSDSGYDTLLCDDAALRKRVRSRRKLIVLDSSSTDVTNVTDTESVTLDIGENSSRPITKPEDNVTPAQQGGGTSAPEPTPPRPRQTGAFDRRAEMIVISTVLVAAALILAAFVYVQAFRPSADPSGASLDAASVGAAVASCRASSHHSSSGHGLSRASTPGRSTGDDVEGGLSTMPSSTTVGTMPSDCPRRRGSVQPVPYL